MNTPFRGSEVVKKVDFFYHGVRFTSIIKTIDGRFMAISTDEYFVQVTREFARNVKKEKP